MFTSQFYKRQPLFPRCDNGETILTGSLPVSPAQEAIYPYLRLRERLIYPVFLKLPGILRKLKDFYTFGGIFRNFCEYFQGFSSYEKLLKVWKSS